MSEVERLYIVFDADGKPYIKGLHEAEAQTDKSASTIEKRLGAAGKVAGMALAAGLAIGATALVNIGTSVVKTAATYEYEMSRIKAVTQASATEMQKVSTLALQLGKDTVFSAAQAAQGINELAKAGVSLGDIIGGGIQGALALASAGELDVASASIAAANAMNMFGLAGTEVMGVADALATAANVSSAEVSDFAEALAMTGTVAAQAGWSYRETIAALAELANQGLKGSDAGTSLKQMFLQLEVPSKKAAEAMKQLGINMYDANGAMLPARDILQNLSRAFEPLNEEQANYNKGVIFGSDAIRAANILIGKGVTEFDRMTTAVSKAGTAQEVAAIKMDNLKGSWEQLKGSLETLAISVGTKMLPQVRELVDGLTGAVNEALETGDWGAVGENIGELVGEGIQMATPYIVDALVVAIKAGAQAIPVAIVSAVTNAPSGSDFAKMRDYLAERMAGVYRDLPKNEAFKKALADLQSYWSTSLFEGRSMFVPEAKTVDEAIALASSMGLILTEDEWKAALGVSYDPAKIAALMKEQAAKVQAAADSALAGLAQGKAVITGPLWQPGDSTTGALEGFTESLAAAGEAGSTAAPGIEDFNAAVGETPELSDAAKDAINGMAGAISGMIDDQAIWNKMVSDGTQNLKDYLKEVQKQLEAEAEWVTNTKTIAVRFGSEFGSDVIAEAMKRGPQFMAALVGADDQTVRDTLTALQTIMYRNSPTHVENIWNQIEDLSTDYAADAGAAGGEAYGKGVRTGITKGLAGFIVWLQSLIGAGKVPFSNYGTKAGGDLGESIETYLESLGMGQAGLGAGKAFAGMASTTAGVWYAQKAHNPAATFLGGRAQRPYTSDHTTGHAYDSDGPGMLSDARWLAAANPGGKVKYIIHNPAGVWHPKTGWLPYVPSAAVRSFAGASAWHRDHVHVSTYDAGGVLPTGLTLAANLTGAPEVIVPASLTKELQNLIDTLKKTLGKGGDLAQALIEAFGQRSENLGTFIGREETRLSTWQTMGVDPGIIAQHVRDDYLRIINLAIVEAQAQLAAAKANGLPAEEIADLTSNLWNLQAKAAEAQRTLEELARTPLEQAATRWGNAIGQLQTMMDLVGNSSNALQLQLQLLPSLLGSMGAQYQTNVDLMGMASTPDQVMGYANAAISNLSAMFGAEQGVINRALSNTLASIDASESSWNAAWQQRASALEASIARQSAALDKQLENLQREQQAELDALNKFYDDRLAAMDAADTAITRAQQRNRATRQLGSLQDELRILQGQGFYTEADIARMHEIESQIQEQQDSMSQQEDAWRRDDEKARLEAEKQTAIKALEQQQESERIALQDQIDAARQALEAQRQAFEEQRTAQQAAFDRQREQARAAAQAEIDALVTKYQAMMQAVIDQQNALLATMGGYQNAGYALGQAFAQGLIDALPLIQAAAQAAAQTAANYLQLASPAKMGPLSDLDKWWEPFVPTLLESYSPPDIVRPVMDTASAARSFGGGEEHIYVHLDGNATGLDVNELADAVSERIKRKVTVSQWSHGS